MSGQFEKSIHRRRDLTPAQKFMDFLSSLKGAAREQISDLMANKENYPLALENLYERYGDKKQRTKELYKSLERARCSNKKPFRMIRELLNLLSQLKGLGENVETAQLDVMVTGRIPEDMTKGLRKKKYKDPEWTMEDTIKYLEEKMKIEEESEVKLPEKGNLVDRTKMQ
uniref:CARD domain-containing protein n=1 Tax=Loa loa TaxID=7209 RepID=A0A1I7VQ80_LOALO